MNLAADTVAHPSRKRSARRRFGMPQEVWWGFTTALVVFVLAPFVVTLFTWLSLYIFFPLGALMGYIALPRFMLAYPFLTFFKDSVLLAYALTAVQLVLQAVLFGWLTRRRTIEQQLLLALTMLVALATAVTLLASALNFRPLTRVLDYY
jgi:multisubunit Na+/H+ antiporter MnhB subunit